MDCQLCEAAKEKYRIIKENKSAFAIIIIEPQIEGHSLVIPKRHITDLKDLTAEESKDLHDLISELKIKIDQVYQCNTTVGLNGKRVITQKHIHYHLLPLPIDVSLRTLLMKTLNVPERVRLSPEKLKEMADKLRD